MQHTRCNMVLVCDGFERTVRTERSAVRPGTDIRRRRRLGATGSDESSSSGSEDGESDGGKDRRHKKEKKGKKDKDKKKARPPTGACASLPRLHSQLRRSAPSAPAVGVRRAHI